MSRKTRFGLICILQVIMVFAARKIGYRRDRADLSVRKSIVAIEMAQEEFRSNHDRYAESTQELAGLINDLAKGEKDGYKFTLEATSDGFEITSAPLEFAPSYYADPSMAIHTHFGPESASASDPLIAESSVQRSQ